MSSAPEPSHNAKAVIMSSDLDLVGLPSPLARDNRLIPQVSNSEFVAFLAFIPVWLTLVLPLSISYQVACRLLRLVGIIKLPPRPPIDSGVAAPATVKPRKDRKYDMVVLGCTGFTGRLAARHLAQKYGMENNKNKEKIKWAMAGRSLSKLKDVRQSLADEMKMPKLVETVDLIVVDTMDASTMPALVEDTRVVATTAGPYQEYGNAVIEFCSKYGTHYVDITGEVGWVKRMIDQWQDVAYKSGAIIIPFCGHDSIPWDLTVFKLNQLLKKKFQDDLATVKIWDEAVAGAPGGTFATALLNLEGKGVNSPRCAIDPFLQVRQDSGEIVKSTHSTIEDLPVLPQPFFDGKWTAPFVMAVVNAKIIRWTHALRQQGAPKLSYREVMVHADFKAAVSSYIGLLMMGSMLLNPITKWLAHQVFLPKPGQGPSYESMEKDNYLLVTAEGIGANGNRAETTFYFPQDPGCMETARMMVESGLVLALNEGAGKKEIPIGSQGGFWPPAAALGDILLERLTNVGAEFNSRVVARPEPKDKKA